MSAKGGYVYIMSNVTRTVLYIGVTSNLESRVFQHREGTGSIFTSKYKCICLIWYEFFDSISAAIEKEKQLKKWRKDWKIDLIRKTNPNFKDLWDEIEGYN